MDSLPADCHPFKTSIRTHLGLDLVFLEELHTLLICGELSIEESQILAHYS